MVRFFGSLLWVGLFSLSALSSGSFERCLFDMAKPILDNKKKARKVHDAMFETLMPTRQELIALEPDDLKRYKINVLAHHRKNMVFDELWARSDTKLIYSLFANLNFLKIGSVAKYYYSEVSHEHGRLTSAERREIKKIQDYIKTKGSRRDKVTSFHELNRSERIELLQIMLTSDSRFLRRLVFSLKIVFSKKLFEGELGVLISGIVPRKEPPANLASPSFEKLLVVNKRKSVVSWKDRKVIDYLIVGTGPAGALIAHELQAAGKRVLVLEKGPFTIPGSRDARGDTRFMEAGGMRYDNDGSLFFLNGEAVGGGSLVNLDLSFPPTTSYVAERFARWHSQASLVPAKLTQNFWAPKDIELASDWVDAKIQPRLVRKNEYTLNNQKFLDGAGAHGILATAFRLNTYANKPGGRATDKKSSADVFLVPSMQVKGTPVQLIPDAEVQRVIFKRKKAIGVEVVQQKERDFSGLIKNHHGLGLKEKTRYKIFARHIILSAGALGSPVILKRSKVRNRNIGCGFVAHPFMPLTAKFDEPVHLFNGICSGVYSDYYIEDTHQGFLLEVMASAPNLSALMFPGFGAEIFKGLQTVEQHGGVAVFLIDSVNPKNCIQIDKKGKPLVKYELSPEDGKRFSYGIAEAARIMFKAGAKEVYFPTYENILEEPDNREMVVLTAENFEEQTLKIEKNLMFRPNQTLTMAAHMTGSVKIGTNPKTSVLNEKHEVWGTKNLYVVDGSVFPESVGANPMQSIYTIAKLFVDRHLQAH